MTFRNLFLNGSQRVLGGKWSSRHLANLEASCSPLKRVALLPRHQ